MSTKLFDCLIEVAPYLCQFFVDDFWVLITDREKVIAYYPGNRIKADIKAGDSVNPAWVSYKAMEKKEKVVEEIDASFLGIPYIGIGSPIYDDEGREIIGAIAIAQATERKDKLLSVSRNLSNLTEIFAGYLEDLSAEAEEMAATGEELNSISNQTSEKVNKSENIVKTIKDISEEISIIGLNAMIEAARVGESGRGFSVVANEVKSLANNTSDSIKDAEEIFSDIKNVTDQLEEAASQISNVSNSQAWQKV